MKTLGKEVNCLTPWGSWLWGWLAGDAGRGTRFKDTGGDEGGKHSSRSSFQAYNIVPASTLDSDSSLWTGQRMVTCRNAATEHEFRGEIKKTGKTKYE